MAEGVSVEAQVVEDAERQGMPDGGSFGTTRRFPEADRLVGAGADRERVPHRPSLQLLRAPGGLRRIDLLLRPRLNLHAQPLHPREGLELGRRPLPFSRVDGEQEREVQLPSPAPDQVP